MMRGKPGRVDVCAAMREGFAALNRRDWDVVVQPYAADSSFESLPLGVKVVGPAAIRAFAEDWLGAFEEAEVIIEELRELGGCVVFAVIRQRGRPLGATELVEQRDAWVAEWAGEKITRVTAFGEIDEGRIAAERRAEELE